MKFKCTANTSPIVIKRYFKMKIRSFFCRRGLRRERQKYYKILHEILQYDVIVAHHTTQTDRLHENYFQV